MYAILGLNPQKGAHSLILSYIEEGKASWDDLPMIQALRESYTYRSQSVKVASHVIRPVRTQTQLKWEVTRRRSISHGILYSHYCNFCHQSGLKFPHTEMGCKKKLGTTKSGTDLS